MEKNDFPFSNIDPEGFFDKAIFSRDDALKMIAKRNNLSKLDDLFVEKLRMNPEETYRNKVCIDMNHEFFHFCMKKNYSAEKIAILLNIFNFCITNGLNKKYTSADINDHVLRLLKKHGKYAIPYTMMFFTEEEIKDIMQFMSFTSKNFFLYEIALTRFIDYNIFSRDPLGVVLPILPLDSGNVIEMEEMVKIAGLSMYMDMVEESEEEEEIEGEDDDNGESPFKLEDEDMIRKMSVEEQAHAVPKTDEQLFFEKQVEQHLRKFSAKVDTELNEKEEEVETKLRTSYPKLFPAQKKKN
jgi:uncharacterized protein (DUF3820 family)